MSDTNTWPDPERPGVPLNPERDGWHWLIDASGVAMPIAWTRVRTWTRERNGAYVAGGWEVQPGTLAGTTRYLGPVLSPVEVATAVTAARSAALDEVARVMLEAGMPISAAAVRALVKEPGDE
jgi:hypothetical protein